MIIYLHGFNSSGKSEKARELGRLLAEVGVLSPDIPSDLEQAVPFLEKFIQPHADEPLMLIGSSLGGYFAQYLGRKFGCPVVLINPALHPIPLLMQHLGKQVNYYSGKEYELTEDAVQSLSRYAVEAGQDHHPTLVLLDKGDEFLDSAETALACPLPINHVTEPLHMGQTKARCADNGCSIGKRRNACMARVQGFPSGEPPGGYLLRCAFLQWNNHCFKSTPCI